MAENLRKWKTGGLRRLSLDKPFPEVIPSGRTPRREKAISDHPCLKPQHFMRIIVRALLPLGEGTVLDPFMGSGSTIAAAEAVGYRSVGIEIDKDYFRLAETAIPKLAALYPTFEGDSLNSIRAIIRKRPSRKPNSPWPWPNRPGITAQAKADTYNASSGASED